MSLEWGEGRDGGPLKTKRPLAQAGARYPIGKLTLYHPDRFDDPDYSR